MNEIPPDLQGFTENGDWKVDVEEDQNPEIRFGLKRERESAKGVDEGEFYEDERDQD